MYALTAMLLSLGLLVTLMHRRVKLGRSMLISSLALGGLLKVTPVVFFHAMQQEWNNKPLSQTTGYLWITLTALVMLVNVLGKAMKEAGLSDRLAPALQALFRSRRIALAAVPMIMGLLPTPGGIMLSAPMVRDMGDQLGIERSRLAAINFLFRHQFEMIWPLFPAVPLIQGMFALSARTLILHNIPITLAGIIGGSFFLLLRAIPSHSDSRLSPGQFTQNMRHFLQVLWPIGLVAALYATIGLPPALGVLGAILIFLPAHKVPVNRWKNIFKAGFEMDFALLICGALMFKLNLEAGGAIESVVGFLQQIHAPKHVVIFMLPFTVAFLTGITMPTVAMTFPFLMPYIVTGNQVKMGLEVLAFSGVICGLLLTPVHLCLALSAGYFECPLHRIMWRLLPPAVCVALAGVIMASLCG